MISYVPTQMYAQQPTLQNVLTTNANAGVPGDTTKDVTGGQVAADAYKYLCTVSNKGCTDHVTKLNPSFAQCLAKFMQAGAQAGQSMKINSGFRSKERQAELFAQAVQKYGSPAAARKWVAPAGNSRHNFGVAVDLANAGSWAHQNAQKFGLHFRMGHEPWHIEPMGSGCNSGNGPAGGDQSGGVGAPPPSASGATPPDSSGGSPSGQSSGGDAGGSGSGSGSGSPSGGGSGSGSSGGGSSGGGGSAPQSTPQSAPQTQSPLQNLLNTLTGTTEMTLDCPSEIDKGDTAEITWECPSSATLSRGATSRGKFNTGSRVSGSVQVQPTQRTVYAVQCLNSSQKISSKSCTVSVTIPYIEPDISFTASDTEVLKGETVELRWGAQNVTACTMSGPDIESTGKRGVVETDPLIHTTSYILKCTDMRGGPVEREVTVRVVKKKTSTNESGEIKNPLEDGAVLEY